MLQTTFGFCVIFFKQFSLKAYHLFIFLCCFQILESKEIETLVAEIEKEKEEEAEKKKQKKST